MCSLWLVDLCVLLCGLGGIESSTQQSGSWGWRLLALGLRCEPAGIIRIKRQRVQVVQAWRQLVSHQLVLQSVFRKSCRTVGKTRMGSLRFTWRACLICDPKSDLVELERLRLRLAF
jgi:hypothetical protein